MQHKSYQYVNKLEFCNANAFRWPPFDQMFTFKFLSKSDEKRGKRDSLEMRNEETAVGESFSKARLKNNRLQHVQAQLQARLPER